MKRALCVWLPNWPLQRLLASRPELKRQAVVLYEAPAPGGLRVVTCSARARASGIVPGMPLAEATALATNRLAATPRVTGAKPAREAPTSLRLHLEQYDPTADRLALEQLAEWCQQFSPTVGLEEGERPASLLLDASGLGSLFGGETAFAEQVVRVFYERGLMSRVAISDTIGSAWAAAHYGAELEPALRAPKSNISGKPPHPFLFSHLYVLPAGRALSAIVSLPVEALRLPDETVHLLAELGLYHVGDAARLPRSTLLSRFGPRLLERLDQTAGLAGETIVAQKPPAELDAHRLLEYPTDRRETIDFVLEQLIARLADRLARERKGVLRLECAFDFQTGPQASHGVGLFRPSASARHLVELMRLRLEGVRFSEPICGVRVAVTGTAPLEFEQQEMFAEGHSRRSPRQLAVLVDRLSSRLGREAVLRPEVLPEAQPEYACRYVPLAGTGFPRKQRARAATVAVKRKSGGKRQPATRPAETELRQRPLHLKSKPVPLPALSVAPQGPPAHFHFEGRDHRISTLWGPERIETGWWRARCVRRDYYRIETTTGERFWLFRRLQDGGWFLHGEFA